jgi:diaminopimelate decarboxylase
MSGPRYVNNKLSMGKRDLESVARKYGTPVYVYDLQAIKKQAKKLKSSLPPDCLIQYAMKANSNLKILKTLRACGLGADVVSGGEMKIALRAGFKPMDIVFSGVAKTIGEIDFAITKQIRSINVESLAELERILEIAKRKKKIARVSLRINPNVSARTHKHITTGRDYNKFGVSKNELGLCVGLLNRNKNILRLVGLTFHLGSQIQSLSPYKAAINKTKKLVLDLISEGHPLEHLSVGGGLAIKYSKENPLEVNNFGAFVRDAFKKLPLRPMCEPGRVLVGAFGVLLTEVQYIKNSGSRKFAIVDTGMHHLMRPALYDAFHEIVPLTKAQGKAETFEIVGPICESTDVLGRGRRLTGVQAGSRLAILNAGAYGFVMANKYNSHELPKEIFV